MSMMKYKEIFPTSSLLYNKLYTQQNWVGSMAKISNAVDPLVMGSLTGIETAWFPPPTSPFSAKVSYMVVTLYIVVVWLEL